jgi:hypothetical protein
VGAFRLLLAHKKDQILKHIFFQKKFCVWGSIAPKKFIRDKLLVMCKSMFPNNPKITILSGRLCLRAPGDALKYTNTAKKK